MQLNKRQKGVVLVIVLILLVVATLLTTTSLRTNVLDQKMLANFRDHDIAFQAAEATLLYAEKHILDNTLTKNQFTESCEQGYCLSQAQSPIWKVTKTQDYWKDSAITVAKLEDSLELIEKPSYLIEWLEPLPAQAGSLVEGKEYREPETGPSRYRVSARAQGKSTESVVILQSIFHR